MRVKVTVREAPAGSIDQERDRVNLNVVPIMGFLPAVVMGSRHKPNVLATGSRDTSTRNAGMCEQRAPM